jgi:hypothetical protein
VQDALPQPGTRRSQFRDAANLVNATERQEEIGHTQVAFRRENEAIQASSDALSLFGSIPFVCECARADCSAIVRLTFDEYEAIRQHPRRFFNVSGHEATSVEESAEVIVAVSGDLTVVEKIGIAGTVATERSGTGE